MPPAKPTVRAEIDHGLQMPIHRILSFGSIVSFRLACGAD
jgi:hypothetical protein